MPVGYGYTILNFKLYLQMKKSVFLGALLLMATLVIPAVEAAGQEFVPVRGLCVAAPAHDDVGEFVALIDKELAPAGVNTLILRVDFGYRFTSRPELVGRIPLKSRTSNRSSTPAASTGSG